MAQHPLCAGNDWYDAAWAANILKNNSCSSLREEFYGVIQKFVGNYKPYLLALLHMGMEQILSHCGVDEWGIPKARAVLELYPFAETVHMAAHLQDLIETSPLLSSKISAGAGCSTDGTLMTGITRSPSAAVDGHGADRNLVLNHLGYSGWGWRKWS